MIRDTPWQNISFQDIMPTFSEIIGFESVHDTDGVSFLPTLLSKKQEFHDFLNWEFQLSGWFQEIPNGGFRQSARMGKWKAVRYNLDSDIEVYNIENDKEETEDLAKMYPDVVKTYPMTEDHIHLGAPSFANFSYGFTKRSLSVGIEAYNRQYNLQYNYMIPCNLYGEYDHFEDPEKCHFITALIRKIIDAEKSDIFDVLEFVAFAKKPLTRVKRIEESEETMQNEFNQDQMEFINFVLDQYENEGVLVLDDEKLPILLELKYKSLENAKHILGDLNVARNIFLDFQKVLYKV